MLNQFVRECPRDCNTEMRQLVIASTLFQTYVTSVMAAVRVIMGCLNYISDKSSRKTIIDKLSPPLGRHKIFEILTTLVTLLSKDHEIQYVALRNIRLLLQQEPSVCLLTLNDEKQN